MNRYYIDVTVRNKVGVLRSLKTMFIILTMNDYLTS